MALRVSRADTCYQPEKKETSDVHRLSHVEKGLKLRREVLGADYVDNSVANANDFTQAFQEITTEWRWGYAWSRPGLDKKTRSMLNLAMLTALNRAPELKLHVRGALTMASAWTRSRRSWCRPPSIAACRPASTPSRRRTRC